MNFELISRVIEGHVYGIRTILEFKAQDTIGTIHTIQYLDYAPDRDTLRKAFQDIHDKQNGSIDTLKIGDIL